VFIIRSALSLCFSWWSCPLSEWLKTWQILMVSGLIFFPFWQTCTWCGTFLYMHGTELPLNCICNCACFLGLDVAYFYICMEHNYLWTSYVIVLAFWVLETRKTKNVHRPYFLLFFCDSMLLFLSLWFRHHAFVCTYSSNMLEICMQWLHLHLCCICFIAVICFLPLSVFSYAFFTPSTILMVTTMELLY
jgi:hypothetical protein